MISVGKREDMYRSSFSRAIIFPKRVTDGIEFLHGHLCSGLEINRRLLDIIGIVLVVVFFFRNLWLVHRRLGHGLRRRLYVCSDRNFALMKKSSMRNTKKFRAIVAMEALLWRKSNMSFMVLGIQSLMLDDACCVLGCDLLGLGRVEFKFVVSCS